MNDILKNIKSAQDSAASRKAANDAKLQASSTSKSLMIEQLRPVINDLNNLSYTINQTLWERGRFRDVESPNGERFGYSDEIKNAGIKAGARLHFFSVDSRLYACLDAEVFWFFSGLHADYHFKADWEDPFGKKNKKKMVKYLNSKKLYNDRELRKMREYANSPAFAVYKRGNFFDRKMLVLLIAEATNEGEFDSGLIVETDSYFDKSAGLGQFVKDNENSSVRLFATPTTLAAHITTWMAPHITLIEKRSWWNR